MNQIQLKAVDIIDRNFFNQAVKALEVSIPVDWESSGGISWNFMAAPPTQGMKIDWWAASNDRSYGVYIPPTESWQANNVGMTIPGCTLNAPISTIKEYLESLVRRHRPNARIISYSDRSDLTTNLSHLNQTTPMPNGELKTWVQGGQILISYDESGYSFEEIIMATATFVVNRSSNILTGVMEFLSGETNPGFAMRSPVGKLNFKLAETIRKSFKTEPNWQAAVAQYQQEVTQNALDTQQQISQMNHQSSQNNLQHMRRRGQIKQQAMNDVGKINRNIWQNKQAAQDRAHRQFSQTMRGVASFYDPRLNKSVELSNDYENAWQLNDGDRAMTNDPSFNPYRDLGIDGYQLKRVQ